MQTLTTSAHSRPGTASVHPWSPAGPPRSSGSSSLTPPAPGSAPEPPSRLPPLCLPICLRNTRPSTPLSCLRMSTRAPGLAGSSALVLLRIFGLGVAHLSPHLPPPLGLLAHQRAAPLSMLRAPHLSSFRPHLSRPLSTCPGRCGLWLFCPCEPPHCHPHAVPVPLEPCGGLTSSLWLRHPKLCRGHILPKRDPDQTRSVSATLSPIEVSPSPCAQLWAQPTSQHQLLLAP